MNSTVQDLRFALRRLRHTPAFTITALATLAIAIGGVTAVFGIVNGVLLNPLGFAHPDALVYVQAVNPDGGPESISPQDLTDFQAQNHSFTAMAAVDPGRSMTFQPDSAPAERLSAARVGGAFFDILGVRPQAGRFFEGGADARGAPKVVVLSNTAWQRDFGGDPGVVGRRLNLNGGSYEVVAVAPPNFTFPASPDLWYPAQWRDWEVGDTARGIHSVHAIARLRSGVSLQSARTDLATLAHRIAVAWPRYDARIGATAAPLRDHIVGDVETPLWILFGAVSFVLLIACVNLSNLMLVRNAARASEVAVRTALGAGRRRLVRQFVTESVVLAAAGSLLGLLIATWALALLARYGPADLPRLREIALDGRVFAFAALLAGVVGIAFGAIPAIHATRDGVAALMRSGSRGILGGAGRTRSSLVVAELALGTMLLVGAGLLIRSFNRLMSVDPGFRGDHVIVLDATLNGPKYRYDAGTDAFVDAVLARLEALPGTIGAAAAANRPFDPDPDFEASTSFTLDGAPKPEPGHEPESRMLPVSPGYFKTMRMTLLQGRLFADADNSLQSRPVVVVNEALARKYFPGESPIGKHITFGFRRTVSADPTDTVRARGEIIGVVRTVQHAALDAPPEPATYFPYAMMPFGPSFVVRTAADPSTVQREIRAQVAAVDPGVPVYELQTLQDAVAATTARPRFYTTLCSAFALAALLLAVIGIYGVMSYSVAQRRREFGIRVALGATPRGVEESVVRQGARLIAAGLALGIVGAALATRALTSLLFGVRPLDPVAFGAACALLALVATVSCWLPARRAARVDPVTAIREE